jgi:hypothetical protein
MWSGGNMSSRLCSGRILLQDGRPMVEGELLVPALEPPPVVHAYGAAFIIGLDAFQRFRVCFDWCDTETADRGHPPTFSLTPSFPSTYETRVPGGAD